MQKPPSCPYPEFASKGIETSRRAFVEYAEELRQIALKQSATYR